MEEVGSIDRPWPMTSLGGDAPDRDAIDSGPSIATSGTTGDGAALYTGICAALPSNAENGTGTTIPEVGWPVNVPSVSDPLVPRIEAESVTSKPIP